MPKSAISIHGAAAHIRTAAHISTSEKSRLTAGLFIPCLLAAAVAQAGHDNRFIETVEVEGRYESRPVSTGDASALLKTQGVDFSSAGGISGLPVLRGLNDDRVRLVVDGAEITSACANHMNPPLSYIDASRIVGVDVIAGITPVSRGGDSIAGTIVVESLPPQFAESEEKVLRAGSAGYFYQSNNHHHGAALNATVADTRFSLGYAGSIDMAESYYDGHGDKVLDTLYRSESHNLTFGFRAEQQRLTVRLTHQEVPYQGFPNQYMDMVGNTSNGINTQYLRTFDWGVLDASLSWQDVDHEMGFFTAEKDGTMPMLTEGQDVSYALRLELPRDNDGVLRIGHEFHQFRLDDWWPAVEGSMMMGPDDYININNGERTRYAFYAESEQQIRQDWQLLGGVRYEHVVMNTGDVQPYNTMSMGMMPNLDAPAAVAFNARDHRRRDDNIDLTLQARHQFNTDSRVEFGYARKTRSPNLYERYSWGRNAMAMAMVGWFGDGNGYVGDIDLAPEIAHTLSVAFDWQDSARKRWTINISPYFTYVDDYIDAEQIGSFNPRQSMAVTRPRLQFVNLDAELYGVDIKGSAELLEKSGRTLTLTGQLAYTHGKRSADDSDLYHIMPLNLQLGLDYRLQQWTHSLEVEWVDNKTRVDDHRLEGETDSYAVVDFHTQYEWRQLTLSAGVSNLFDRYYEEPLGGVYLSGWIASDKTGPFTNLPGMGRSYELGVTYQF